MKVLGVTVPPAGGRTHGTLRLDLVYFLHARLPAGSYCVRHISHIFADIIRARLQTLRRIFAGAQIDPQIVHVPPKFKNCGFRPKLRASCSVTTGAC